MPHLQTDIPAEVIRRILLFTVPPVGPPTTLSRLRRTCRSIHHSLQQSQVDLYTRIFSLQFDLDPPFRRLGYNRRIILQNVENELQRRFMTLKRLRDGVLGDEALDDALWMTYIMLIEDEGHNLRQLRWANTYAFLQKFLRDRLYNGAEFNHGWPLENHQNALAAASLWLMSSKASIHGESLIEREGLMNQFAPLVEAAFRYPCFSSAETLFTNSVDRSTSPSSATVHGPYPPSQTPPHNVPIFGSVTHLCYAPAISSFAILSYFARADVIPHAIPPHLPKTRIEANAANQTGPTCEDVQYFIDHCNTKFSASEFDFAQRSGWQHESDWLRLTGHQAYSLGCLTGRFDGSMMVPCVDVYTTWLSTLDMPQPFPTFGRRPLSLIIKEYYCTDLSMRLPFDDPKNGIGNAWLPAGCKFIEQDDGIEMFDEEGTYQCFYQSYLPGTNRAELEDVADVVVVAKPDEAYKTAWGGFHLFGRIRPSDGLVVLAGEAVEVIYPSIFRGYVISSQNFVGRSRGQLTSGFEPASWEAAFSLSKATTS